MNISISFFFLSEKMTYFLQCQTQSSPQGTLNTRKYRAPASLTLTTFYYFKKVLFWDFVVSVLKAVCACPHSSHCNTHFSLLLYFLLLISRPRSRRSSSSKALQTQKHGTVLSSWISAPLYHR